MVCKEFKYILLKINVHRNWKYLRIHSNGFLLLKDLKKKPKPSLLADFIFSVIDGLHLVDIEISAQKCPLWQLFPAIFCQKMNFNEPSPLLLPRPPSVILSCLTFPATVSGHWYDNAISVQIGRDWTFHPVLLHFSYIILCWNRAVFTFIFALLTPCIYG